jgi:hypothetical protein
MKGEEKKERPREKNKEKRRTRKKTGPVEAYTGHYWWLSLWAVVGCCGCPVVGCPVLVVLSWYEDGERRRQSCRGLHC